MSAQPQEPIDVPLPGDSIMPDSPFPGTPETTVHHDPEGTTLVVWEAPDIQADMLLNRHDLTSGEIEVRNPPDWFVGIHQLVEHSYENLHSLFRTKTVSIEQAKQMRNEYHNLFDQYREAVKELRAGSELQTTFMQDLARNLEQSCLQFAQSIDMLLATRTRDSKLKKQALDNLDKEACR